MVAQSTNTKLEVIQNDLGYVRRDVAELKRLQQNEYLTKDEFNAKFNPVKRIAYGIVGIFATIIGALLLWTITTILGGS